VPGSFVTEEQAPKPDRKWWFSYNFEEKDWEYRNYDDAPKGKPWLISKERPLDYDTESEPAKEPTEEEKAQGYYNSTPGETSENESEHSIGGSYIGRSEPPSEPTTTVTQTTVPLPIVETPSTSRQQLPTVLESQTGELVTKSQPLPRLATTDNEPLTSHNTTTPAADTSPTNTQQSQQHLDRVNKVTNSFRRLAESRRERVLPEPHDPYNPFLQFAGLFPEDPTLLRRRRGGSRSPRNHRVTLSTPESRTRNSSPQRSPLQILPSEGEPEPDT